MNQIKVKQRREEFFLCVWDHSQDKFQTSFDERRNLFPSEIRLLSEILGSFNSGLTDEEIALKIKNVLAKESSKKLIEILLQLCGITRNKILQDLKASSTGRRNELRLSSYLGLASHNPTWEIAGIYLVKKLRKVMYHPQAHEPLQRMFEALNQATWPGYIRQERAKRSGHEAEYRIATLLNKVGISFIPEEKADNPLCRDAMWNEISFDIIIPDLNNPKICIKSTVHTSNIGQYGESKDHLEVEEARKMIDEKVSGQKPLLVAFIDGVGFESNSAGLNGILDKSDEFCQFNTIWKLPILTAHVLNKKCQLWLDNCHAVQHKIFLEKYKNSVQLMPRPISGGVDAGQGIVKLL